MWAQTNQVRPSKRQESSRKKRYLKCEEGLTKGKFFTADFEDGGNPGVNNDEWPLGVDDDPPPRVSENTWISVSHL